MEPNIIIVMVTSNTKTTSQTNNPKEWQDRLVLKFKMLYMTVEISK
jgi:hypothetical protein